MDPLERLLRDANPVPETSDPPLDPDGQLKSLLSELRNTGTSNVRDIAAKVAGAERRRRTPRRLIPALAAMAVLLGLAAAGFGAALTWISPQSPTPAGTPSSTPTAEDGWRLAGFAPGPAGNEAHIHLMVARGWELAVNLPSDDYPARDGWLYPADPSKQGILAKMLLYYGPYGPRYDPAACAGPEESFVELDSSPVNIPHDASVPGTASPRFVYRVVQADRLVASFGITTRPPSTSIDSCNQYFQVRAARAGYYFTFSTYGTYTSGHPGWLSPVSSPASMEFASIDDARAFLETEDYATIKRMLTSLTISAP